MARGQRVALLPLLAAVFLFLPTADADACSCSAPGPICETFWKTPVVFSGQVLEIATVVSQPGDPGTPGPFESRKVRFRVERAWRGDVAGEIDIYTGAGGGDCGVRFERGEQHLVFARVFNGRMTTGICTPTKRLRDAAEDLAYVKGPFLPSAGGRIFGRALFRDSRDPLPNTKVMLRGASREWTTTTDAAGRYEFKDIPAGRYRAQLGVAEQLHAAASDAELADPRGCAQADFYVAHNGRIVLKVLMANGDPARDMWVELIDASTLEEQFPRQFYPAAGPRVPDTGEMEWGQLPPGRYVIAINSLTPPDPKRPYPPTFYPGVGDRAAATVVQVGLGERVELEPFTLPSPQRVLAVVGSVVHADSRPAAGIDASLQSLSPFSVWRPVKSAQTDRDGRFSIPAVAGVRYRVVVFENRQRFESAPFELTPATAPLLIVLRERRRDPDGTLNGCCSFP